MRFLSRLSLMVTVVLALVGVSCAAFFLVVASAPGSRWLLASLSGASFSVQKIEGRLSDHVILSGVRVDVAGQKMNVDTLELRWKPLLLLSGTVAVQELIVAGVRIQDNSPSTTTPPNLTWPKLPAQTQLFDATIARLRVSDLSYQRLQEQPLRVTAINSSVTWQDGLLSITDLTALSPDLQIHGTFSAGLSKPTLVADLTILLAQPVAEMNQFSVQMQPVSTTGAEFLAGTVSFSGSAGKKKVLQLSGDVGLTEHTFNLRRLRASTPGRKGVVVADGSLKLTAGEPVLSVKIEATGLDLAPELKVPTDLSGTLTCAGTLEKYRGNFTFANKAKGWQAITVSSAYRGTRETVNLAPFTATAIDGALAGNLDINWRSGVALKGTLSGRNLNPAKLDPAWHGVANFNATGSLVSSGDTPLTGTVSASLLESRVHGQKLRGEVQAKFSDTHIILSRLFLQGKGFDLQASGDVQQRLIMSVQVSDLSRLVPGTAGTLQGTGWVRWRDRQLSGDISATGGNLDYSGTRIQAATLKARLDNGKGYPGHIALSLQNAVYGNYALTSATIIADGSLPHHTVHATVLANGGEVRLSLSAGYTSDVWKGTLTDLTGRDPVGPWNLTAPAAFAVSAGHISVSPLALTSGSAERVEASTDLNLNPLSGQLRVQWADLNLDRTNPYLNEARITGRSNGTVRLGFLSGKRLTLSGSAAGNGTFTGKGGSITIEQSMVTFDGSERGLRIGLKANALGGGKVKGTFSSTAPFLLALPEQGKVTAEFSDIDVAMFKPWIPEDTTVTGRIDGQTTGVILPGQHFEINGSTSLSDGTFRQRAPGGGLNLTFTSAAATWKWRDEALAGTVSLSMSEYGQTRANFNLPVPARFPIAVNLHGPLRASVNGQLQEQGLITALFPGMVQKSFGTLDVNADIGGTWDVPQIGGIVRLTKAGAYLPGAGIHLSDVQLAAHLERNLIRIESFRAVSGTGHIEGTALVTLSGWRVNNYQGTIQGERFQTFYLPEFRLLTAPRLAFEGTPEKLTVRGELRLPEMRLDGAPATAVIAPSSDVIREGILVSDVHPSPLALDVQIRVLLGERIFVKVAGIDAQLGGAMDVSLSSLDTITSAGEIKVVKGRYRTYGVNLDIVRGRLFFAGGALDKPALDFLALRTVGDIRAGVTVTGSLQKPVAKLYSEPAMPDVDVLAYIVLGHPFDSSGEQVGLMTQAAGALLTSSQASDLQQQLKDEFGLSTLEIQGGVGSGGSSMGYKPLQVTAPGTIPSAMQSGITETVLTVGKYLTPKLYVSYGKSLFTGSNMFLMRYDIFKKWQIETQTGGESGVDLFYKLEFK
ncbi:MAG: translocation/assembly module TamB domain-containing protein [Desulfuromonadaceae bacterium]|nr:translocation/assembly module TamB domain-containing protein [Desulfuromonadaceae bacterium]